MKWMESNTQALPYVQATLTALTVAWAVFAPSGAQHWGWSIALYAMIGCFGISIGYHRLLTHRSFLTSTFWERFCTIWGMLAFTGSSIGWVGVHRDHHRFSDKEGDPHSPVTAGAKMLIASYPYNPNKWQLRHLVTDPFHRFIHRYYFGLLAAYCVVVLLVGGTSALMHVALIPACISIWVSTVSNYMNHKWGYRNFKTTDSSRNNWFNALFTFGEGWHNNHHAYPGMWKFSYRWWEVDLGALVIGMIRK